MGQMKKRTESPKLGLSVLEAGWLLQKTEAQVRGMLRRGELAYVVDRRKIDPASVRRRLHGAYPDHLLDCVLDGKFPVPVPEYRSGPPAPLDPERSASFSNWVDWVSSSRRRRSSR